MPRVGGVYSLPPGYFATDGTTIVVSQHNPPLEDIAQALTDSLPRDGSAPMTGSLNMGTKKITNLAAATNPADAVRFDQISDPAAIALATLQTYGWAIVGNAPTLANIDATTTPSGQYRFIAGASGTFPTGVVAADTGQIIMIRETVNEGSMILAVGAGRLFWRALVAGAWGAWSEYPLVASNAARGAIPVRGASAWGGLALGTNGQVAKSNGTDLVYGGPRQVSSVATTTSGTTHDITGVPTTALFFTLHCYSVSLSGTDNLYMQLLDSGGTPITTGYFGTGGTIDNTAVATIDGPTSAFGVFQVGNSDNFTGRMSFARVPGTNLWVQDHTGRRSLQKVVHGGGRIDAGGGVTGIRLLASGANTFDAGSAWISWEAA